MKDLRSRFVNWPVALLLAVAVVAIAPAALAQDVEVEVEVTGDPLPGGSVTAMAVVTINDGSTIESYAWEQVGGVPAVLDGVTTDTVTVDLGPLSEYKAELVHVLMEPPIGPDQLPPNVPPPEGEFPAGLQNRWEIVGLNPFSLEETGAVELEVTVVTTSGSYVGEGAVHTTLPWKVATGVNNVPVGRAVLLNGKEQASYDWALTAPAGSSATLTDATERYPYFTPDVMGTYTVEVTDENAGAATITLSIFAGTWVGVIVGQDAEGRPVADSQCTGCHNGAIAPDVFTPWAQTGHAEIFTNSLNTNDHYSANCFACHTVGYDPEVANGGIDEAADYQAFLDSGLLGAANPDAWTTVLSDYPATARLANIQCENCHGPQMSPAHTQGSMARGGLSSNTCATCHGEPLRHARFQQWQLSKHADYELAIEEGGSGNCSRCHTANGFLAWLPVLTGVVAGDPEDSVEVTWTEDEVHPQTCIACHDPHNIGTTSGNDSNANVWISGDTPPLLAGFTATEVGRGAICMTCHNSRRGLRNDSNFGEIYRTSEAARSPHGPSQTDVLMGQNAYFVEVGNRGFHSLLEDTCADCHMEETPPPPDLAYNLGGSNHTFYASDDICANCHNVVTAPDVQVPVEEALNELQGLIEDEILDLIAMEIAEGNTVDLDGEVMITDADTISDIEFGEFRGRHAITVTFTDMSVVGPVRMPDVLVVPTDGDPYEIYDDAPPFLPKSGWNYLLFHNDGSLGVHNPDFAMDTIEVTIETVETDGGGAGGGGGSGGAVSCTTPYVYWTEIAAHNLGAADSVWRTDVVGKNTADLMAEIEFILHMEDGMETVSGNIDAGAQGIFEDVVGLMGLEDDKGALEICSNRPLEVVARIYNLGDDGSFGQFLNGFGINAGMSAGQSARLLGLRQVQGEFRTNINVTNTGLMTATVEITLYDSAGTELTTYELEVGSGMSVQDLQPFRSRANAANVGWGYAEVTVTEGEGIISSASVIDSRTNDATTIPMKR